MTSPDRWSSREKEGTGPIRSTDGDKRREEEREREEEEIHRKQETGKRFLLSL